MSEHRSARQGRALRCSAGRRGQPTPRSGTGSRVFECQILRTQALPPPVFSACYMKTPAMSRACVVLQASLVALALKSHTGGGGYFGRGQFRGEIFFFQIGAVIPAEVFCQGVMVPVYCTSGSVFMRVRIPKQISCVSCVSQILCTQCVSQRIFVCICSVSQGLSLQLYTRHQNLGCRNFPTRKCTPPCKRMPV